MCKRISQWMSRVSTGPVTLAALAAFLLFTALVLPGQSAQAERASGDVGSPDTSFWYGPADLYQMAEAYGAAGRAAYVRARFTFDLIWPLVYAVFLCTAISWAFGRGYPDGHPAHLVNLVPLLGTLFDFLENIATSLVMLRYPARTPVLDALAGSFTALKWILLGASFLLLIAGLVLVGWRRLMRSARS